MSCAERLSAVLRKKQQEEDAKKRNEDVDRPTPSRFAVRF